MSFADSAAWMLRCHTGWPGIDDLKRSSVEALQLPPSWEIQQDSNQERPAADFILVSDSGQRFAVVIESFEHVMLLTSSRGQRLLWRNGMPILPDPIKMMEKLATRTRAAPVLWLPRARFGVFDVRTDTWPVMVVRGRAGLLEQVIYSSCGARTS